MRQKIITLIILLLFTFQITHAEDQDFEYSKPVQNSLNILQTIYTTLQLDPQPEIITDNKDIDPILKTLLKQKNEQKIQNYIADRKAQMIKQLHTEIQKGDATATVAIVEYALMFADRSLLQTTDLAPLFQLSQQKIAYASYLLARYFEGTKDYIPFLEKAAHQGSSIAQLTLVDEYGFRLPIEQQDPKKAEYWANAAKQSLGEDAYMEQKCALANCDTESFEFVDFSEVIQD